MKLMTFMAAAIISLSSALAVADDAIGTAKAWGSVDVTLKAYSVKGKTSRVELLLKNNSDKAENISSLMQFAVLSTEGDKGEWNMGTRCDGLIPPRGLLKCRLVNDFPAPPASLIIQVGAGFDGEPVYFNVPVK